MKPKIKTILEESEREQLLDVLNALVDKYNYLNEELEFILIPKNIKNPQSYYNKLVKKAIDTNSWSKFPNKGIKGLELMLGKLEFLEKMGNYAECQKLAIAILEVIARCKRNYNNQNVEELKKIRIKLQKYWI